VEFRAEFGGGETLFTFELNFEEFEPGLSGAGCEQAVVFHAQLAGLGAAEAEKGKVPATSMRWTISFLPCSVVKAPARAENLASDSSTP